jgi:hypothetical protein
VATTTTALILLRKAKRSRVARRFVFKPKIPIWVNFEGLAIENLGIFYDHLVYFTAIGNIYGHLVYFVVIWYNSPRFGILYQEKSGNPERSVPS